MTKKAIGIVIGRFQPFHTGHQSLITKSLNECENTVVFIGSANKSRDYNNPLTNEERKETILNSYKGTPALHIVFLHDKPTLEEWVANVYGLINHMSQGEDDVDPSTVTLYVAKKDEPFYTENFLFNTEVVGLSGISGTEVRKNLYKGSGTPFADMPHSTLTLLKGVLASGHWRRMKEEYNSCVSGKAKATLSHAYSNPIEPVVHAVVVQGTKALLVKRNSVRGYGQWALPGGFLEANESTQEGALRELWEETGIDLKKLQCAQLAVALEENLDDISVRTLGVNYLFVVKESEEIEVLVDKTEVLDYKWTELADITGDKEILFYNHNLVVQRLMASVPSSGENE